MNPARTLSRALSFLLPAAGLFLFLECPAADDTSAKTDYTTNEADRAACERQLNMIGNAIQQYRLQHDDSLPAKLSDLAPDYIHDPNVLICPFVQKRGGLRKWKKQFRELGPDPYTSYGYEFAPAPMDEWQWRGLPKKTWQEFKQRVAEELGPVVPIVRCHDHRPWLNLATGGQIYQSELYWEKNFVTNDHLLTVANLFAGQPPVRPTASDFPPRDPRASPRQLDLTAVYNATLTNSWQGFAGNHLAELRPGLHEFGGVRFDVRGVIQLQGMDLPEEYPTHVADLDVHQKCSKIHFLHAQSFGYRFTNALYLMHYTDGRVQEFPIVYGRHIADWWCDPANLPGLTDATIAWTGGNEAAREYGRSLCLYHATWENPWKDAEIETITFDARSRKSLSGPFVVAITLE